jgi:hypothetical protein
VQPENIWQVNTQAQKRCGRRITVPKRNDVTPTIDFFFKKKKRRRKERKLLAFESLKQRHARCPNEGE